MGSIWFECQKSWKLRIVGPDEAGHLATLISLVKKYKLEDSVVFTGPKFEEDLSQEYENCECLILPSFTENFGATIIDALAHGKPCIASTFTPWAELNEKKFILEDTFGASEIEIDSVKRKINDLTYDLDILKDKQKHDEDLYEYRLKIIRDYTREMDNYIEKISNAKIRIHPEDDYRLSWTNRTVVEMYKEYVNRHYSTQKYKELYAKSDVYMDVSVSKQMCEANGLSVEYANR